MILMATTTLTIFYEYRGQFTENIRIPSDDKSVSNEVDNTNVYIDKLKLN